jgi:hypothetical protein
MQMQREPKDSETPKSGKDDAEQPEAQAPEELARELREAARFFEDVALSAVFSYSDIEFPLRPGDLKDFPRPSAEGEAALQGLEVLQESIEEAVAVLNALAAASEDGREVPPALLVFVQPYLDAFRSRDLASLAE